ncbi:MAG: TonB-dependent receptor domain-containing protein [Bacteroidales bacterium]
MKKILILLVLSLVGLGSYAQGVVSGTVYEMLDNEQVPLPFANIIIAGTARGAITDMDGKYSIPLQEGDTAIIFRYLGYDEVAKKLPYTDAQVDIDVVMSSGDNLLENVVVTATRRRNTENATLLEQKEASVAIEAMGAAELSKKGVADVAAGVAKMTGITKQEGSATLNVRGLGDRYNTTTLNGLPLPSNQAEYKNIDLSVLSTDLIDQIGVEKVFTSRLYGDVGGANINLLSKKNTTRKYLQVELGGGYNSNMFDANNFYLMDGTNFMGIQSYDVPSGSNIPSNYDAFGASWDLQDNSKLPEMTFGLIGGYAFELSKNRTLGVIASLSFDNDYNYSEKIERTVNGSGFMRQDLGGEIYSYKSQLTGMLNLNYSTDKMSLSLNSMALNTGVQTLDNLQGFVIDVVSDNETALLRRGEFNQNTIFVNQLLGNHTLRDDLELDWGLAYNNILNIDPDRRTNTFIRNDNTNNYYLSVNDRSDNNRYWHELKENELAANVSLSKSFGQSVVEDKSYRGKVTLGYSGRIKNRDFESYQYNHDVNNSASTSIDIWDVDAFFNNTNYQNGAFDLYTFYGQLNRPVAYSGELAIHAAIANFEYDITDRLLATIGLRFEAIQQNVDYETTIATGNEDFVKNPLLPSLALRYKLRDNQNLRFAVSQTYTLPQFKETAPFQFEGITVSSVGNPYLYPSTNYNVDLKWEMFPKNGELISVGVFGKYIQDPINQFVMASASNDFTYANTGDYAYVAGVEAEVKKDVLAWNDHQQKIYAGANITYMITEQELDNAKVAEDSDSKYLSSFNEVKDELQGAAPLVFNASLGYRKLWNEGKNNINASLVYGYVSDRLFLLGYAGAIGNQYDKAFGTLDFVLKSEFNKLGVSLSAKNLTDASIERYQSNADTDYTVLAYKRGIDFQIKLSYKF